MLKLIPDWAVHDEEFWLSIRRRNLYFIKLRYATILVLLTFLISYKFFLNIELSEIQSNVILYIAAIILIYNLSFHYFRRYLKHDSNSFNPLHLSILQMAMDLMMLLLLVYYSGGVESPIYFFLIFHMIVGSLILPGIIIYSFAFAVIFCFWGITIGSYFQVFEHHAIKRFLSESNYNNFNYVLGVNIVFALVIIITVILANYIAKQLYKKEQQLYSYIDKLNEAEKEKTKYILGIVHELKTPMNALHAYLDIVLQKFLGPIDEVVEEKLIRAKRRSDEAIEMINTILKVSQMKMMDEISFEDFDPAEVCSLAINRHEQFARNKSIEIRFIDARKDKSIKIQGDKFLIMISLSNLIGNSLKYGFENGIVEVKIYDSENYLVFEVCDNGYGIPKEEQKNIFQDFFKASNIRRMVSEGAGLGLSFVKQIVDKHNGQINFQSPSRLQEPGKPGTCFKISLPVR